MNTILSILLSSCILAQCFNIDLGDITKLDEFMEHAQFHNNEYGDNFYVFISKHYGELKENHSKKHKEEKKEHEQLPFDHQSCHHSSIDFILTHSYITFIKSDPVKDTTFNFFYKNSFSSFEKQEVFQPPQQEYCIA